MAGLVFTKAGPRVHRAGDGSLQGDTFDSQRMYELQGEVHNKKLTKLRRAVVVRQDALLRDQPEVQRHIRNNIARLWRTSKKHMFQVFAKSGEVALRFASEELRSDKEFVLAAVEQDWRAMQHACSALKADKAFVLAAVEQDWRAMQHACPLLKEDKAFVLEVVKQDGRCLEFANIKLKGDEDVVLEAVRNNWLAAFSALQKDYPRLKEIMLEAVKQCWVVAIWDNYELLSEKAIALEALQHRWRLLELLPPPVFQDREVVLAAVIQDRDALKEAGANFRGDRAVVLEVVKRHGEALEHANESVRADREVVLEAVTQSGLALKFASKSLRADKEVVLAAVKSDANALEWARSHARADKKIALEVVKKDWRAFKHVDPKLRTDKEFMIEAIKVDGRTYDFVGPALREDQDLLLFAARCLRPRSIDLCLRFEAVNFGGKLHPALQSPIAVAGEEAPVVSVFLTHERDHFHGEVSLLSGTSFACDVADCEKMNFSGQERPCPILDDFATKLVQLLPQQTEVKGVEKLFITFVTDESRGTVPVSPWLWDCPLTDFLQK